MNNLSEWRKIQRSSFRSLDSLLHFLEMDPVHRKQIHLAPSFSINVPLRLAQKMQKNSLTDPLFRQFVPVKEEQKEHIGFVKAPLQDEAFSIEKKLLRKYANRALLLCSSACAMHCRYCFRQNFPYEKEPGFAKELEQIRKDPSLAEIILSGGDPLSLGNQQLGSLLRELSCIAHVKRIRFHSRFIIGIPERIDNAFLDLLESCSTQMIFVVHINHPKELDEDVVQALKKIQKLGIPILNQSVLLQGVNDTKQTLLALSEALVNHGILPYYLHQLDRVQGASHFEVSEEKGIALIEHLQAYSSGYAVPRYVREIPGKQNKTTLHPIESLEPENLEALLQNSSC